jgi:F-type H+-transporting ATPase subunit b
MEILNEIAHKIGFDWRLALTHFINLSIIFFLLAKFALPSIKKTINERTQKISEGLKNFEKSKEVFDNAKKEADSIKNSALKERDSLLSKSEAEAQANISKSQETANEIVKKAEATTKNAEAKGLDNAMNEFKKKLPSFLSQISENAFGSKLTADVNNEFVTKVLK